MKKCPFCGADIEDSARFCLHCMQSLTEKEHILLRPIKKPQWILILAAIVALAVLLILLLPTVLRTPSAPTEPDTTTTAGSTAPIQTEPTAPPHTHSYSEENTAIQYQKSAATCTAAAVYYYSCACGEMGNETFSYGETENHTIVIDAGHPATCANTGLTDGTHCSVCNIVFSSQSPIPVTNHTYDDNQDESCNVCDYIRTLHCRHTQTVTLSAVSPTCTAGGLTEGSACALCEEILTAQTAIAPLGHVEVIDPAVAPTCTTDGRTEGKHCSTCNTVLVPQFLITAKYHTEVIEPWVSPTCTTDGRTERMYCSVCNAVLIAPAILPAKGHTEVIDPAVSPTCTTDGKTEGKHCALCQIVLVYQQYIPASGHAFNSNDPTAPCSECGAESPHVHNFSIENTASEYQKSAATCVDYATYYYSCACGASGRETFTAGSLIPHTIVIEPGYPATCTTPGLTDTSYCSTCNDGFDYHAIIYPLGHSYHVGDEPSACLDCGEMGTFAIRAPELPFVQNGKFLITDCTFRIRPSIDNTWEIKVFVTYTNLTSEATPLCPSASLYLGNSGYGGSCNTAMVQPNASGTCRIDFRFALKGDLYELVFS